MHTLPDQDVILLGIGHTNAHVLHRWREQPPRGARLTCVSNDAVSAYSGMLPGVLAGQYPPERMEIDLEQLCAAAGARLVIADVTGLDVTRRQLLFADRPPLPFDVLSIGVGSVPTVEGVEIGDATRLLPIKPMQTFLARLDERLRQAMDQRRGLPIRVAIVGGGAGGIELALCLPSHVRTLLGENAHLDQTVVSADERLVPGSLKGTGRRIQRVLTRRGVRLVAGRRVVGVEGGRLALDAGMTVEADVIVWATGAAAPPLLATLGLPTDARGGGVTLTLYTNDRLVVRDSLVVCLTLTSEASPPVYACRLPLEYLERPVQRRMGDVVSSERGERAVARGVSAVEERSRCGMCYEPVGSSRASARRSRSALTDDAVDTAYGTRAVRTMRSTRAIETSRRRMAAP